MGPIMEITKKFEHRFIVNFSKYRYLLKELVKRDIKIKYRRSVLGIFWSFLNPLLTMVVLTIIFSSIFASDIENFPVYVLVGKLVFDFFAQGSKAAMMSIIRNASIIKKVYVPKYMYSLGVVLSNFVTFALAFDCSFLCNDSNPSKFHNIRIICHTTHIFTTHVHHRCWALTGSANRIFQRYRTLIWSFYNDVNVGECHILSSFHNTSTVSVSIQSKSHLCHNKFMPGFFFIWTSI